MESSFTKIKPTGKSSTSIKLAKMWKARKLPSISIKEVKKMSKSKLKQVDFSKLTKKVKLPKEKKIAIIKKAIKKVKNVGF